VQEKAKDVQEKLKDGKEEIKSTADDKKTNAESDVLKKVDTKDLDKGRNKAATSKKLTEQKIAMVGKYRWLKRVCCGRMRKVTTPEEGEERFMTLTEDGQVKYALMQFRGDTLLIDRGYIDLDKNYWLKVE